MSPLPNNPVTFLYCCVHFNLKEKYNTVGLGYPVWKPDTDQTQQLII